MYVAIVSFWLGVAMVIPSWARWGGSTGSSSIPVVNPLFLALRAIQLSPPITSSGRGNLITSCSFTSMLMTSTPAPDQMQRSIMWDSALPSISDGHSAAIHCAELVFLSSLEQELGGAVLPVCSLWLLEGPTQPLATPSLCCFPGNSELSLWSSAATHTAYSMCTGVV